MSTTSPEKVDSTAKSNKVEAAAKTEETVLNKPVAKQATVAIQLNPDG